MIYNEIAEIINNQIFPRLIETRLNVFLIGSGKNKKNNLRESIKNEFLEGWYYPKFEVFYPEELFDELFHGKNEVDLLNLENLLAMSSHAIVIVLESAGSIAELGAFANHSELKNRLLVIVDQKYKKNKSFIMLGPIKMLKKKTSSSVIYYNFEDRKDESLKMLGERVKSDVRKIAKNITPDNTIRNLINAQYFLLAVVYIMQPIDRLAINKTIKAVGGETEEMVLAIANTSLNILLRNKELLLRAGKYELTKDGLKRFQNLIKYRGVVISNILDKLRVAVLNSTLRKSRRWGTQVLRSAER